MIVTEYDATWPEEFEALASVLRAALGSLASVLRAALGSLAREIHHVGSTSIPGMLAKPIIDLDIEIAAASDLAATIAALQEIGYEYQGEKGIMDRHAFGRARMDVPRCVPSRFWLEHHLYVCPSGSREQRRHLRFRDRLRAEPELRARYEAVKTEALRIAAGSRARYVEEKARIGQAFFDEVLGLEE